jgi:hypothetical protein
MNQVSAGQAGTTSETVESGGDGDVGQSGSGGVVDFPGSGGDCIQVDGTIGPCDDPSALHGECFRPDGTFGSCDGNGVASATYCDAPALVFQVADTQGGCNGSVCHAGVFPPDLISEGVATRLLDMNAILCPQATYIDSANIENSLILRKLGPSPPCGAQMPFLLPTIAADKLECIRGWISAVAANP